MSLLITTRMFLDRPEVFRRIDKNRRVLLARIGGYGMKVMRRLQRQVGMDAPYSQPGEPPHARVGTMRKLTVYGVTDGGQTVVTGIMPLRGRGRQSLLHGKASVPHLLDAGGRQTFLDAGEREGFTARYQPRPFREPTMRRLWPWAKSLIRRQTLTR